VITLDILLVQIVFNYVFVLVALFALSLVFVVHPNNLRVMNLQRHHVVVVRLATLGAGRYLILFAHRDFHFASMICCSRILLCSGVVELLRQWIEAIFALVFAGRI